ncbi:MAG: hypothetical protein EZS28_031660, partial [Streblomastix strix]
MTSTTYQDKRESSNQIQKSKFIDSSHVQIKSINICRSNCQFQQLAVQKLVGIVCDAVPGADKFISVNRIALFLELLQQKLNLRIEEIITAMELLQRFISKQQIKDDQVLRVSNVGMLIIVSFVLALKLSRDKIPNNRVFANMFGVPIVNLN